MTDRKQCGHWKAKENGPCPDCGEYLAFHEYFDEKRQSFRFNENGEFVEVYRKSSWIKEVKEYANATSGIYVAK